MQKYNAKLAPLIHVVLGGDGHDALFGEGGNDIIFGGAANDVVFEGRKMA